VKPSSGGTCGYVFKVGETYLVYGFEIGRKDFLMTTICSRTRLVEYASEDLAFLRNLRPIGSGGEISGKVYELIFEKDRYIEKPLKGITIRIVNISNSDNQFRIKTDFKGEFSVKVSAGKYSVFPILPNRKKLESTYGSIAIRDGGCFKLDFYVEEKEL
jgi:hypothetical protein